MDALLFAMHSEAGAFTRAGRVYGELTVQGTELFGLEFEGRHFAVCVCGIGKVNAAAAAALLIARGARSILNAGLCGALDQKLSIGQTVSMGSCIQYDFDLTALGDARGHVPGQKGAYFELNEPAFGLKLQSCVCATADMFSDREEDARLAVMLGAAVRDMELAACAQVCEKAGVPLSAVKTVSNVAGVQASDSYEKNKFAALESLAQIAPHILRAL